MRQLERRFFATCATGVEEVLTSELHRLGINRTETGSAGVYFTGSLEDCYRANLWLRCATRVVLEVGRFEFKTSDDYYNGAKAVSWGDYFRMNQTFAVFANVRDSEIIRHSGYAALRVKDAVADSFRSTHGRRPNVDATDPDVRIFVHISGDQCILNVDTSGDSLHKRGYRTEKGRAPIRETLAAAILLMAGYDGSQDFYDFMCGAGTLPIEAALIATNRAPGLSRQSFGFQRLISYNRRTWSRVQNEAAAKKRNAIKRKVNASDISKRSIEKLKSNARRAGVREFMNITVSDLKDTSKKSESGIVAINPPYGHRLDYNQDEEKLKNLYSLIGDTLKQNYTGHDAYIISGNMELVKSIGLKASQKKVLYNGPIECRLLKYELYQGSVE